MTANFIAVLNMSITASYVALAVIAVRLLLKKTPKIFSYALWAVVLFRLICPFSFESDVSIIPVSGETIPSQIVYAENPAINSGIEIIDKTVNQAISSSPLPKENVSYNQTAIPMWAFTNIWLFGVLVMLAYGVFSYLRLKHRLYYATLVRDNIFETDKIGTAFVLGFIKPKIYIPVFAAEKEIDYILKHEQIHIKRFDYLIKPLAFLALALHWFNPIVWLCFTLMNKDMEMSCDEAVIKQSVQDIRADYSFSLLALAKGSGEFLSPIAFGDSNSKVRIKNILNYKRPAFWAVLIGASALIICALTLAANPKGLVFKDKNTLTTMPMTAERLSADFTIGNNGWVRYGEYLLTPDKTLQYITLYAEIWENGELKNSQYCSSIDLSKYTDSEIVIAPQIQTNAADKNRLGIGVKVAKPDGSDSTYAVNQNILLKEAYSSRTTVNLSAQSPFSYPVTLGHVIILTSLGYTNKDNINAYTNEYLMENPDSLKEYEAAVLIKAVFTAAPYKPSEETALSFINPKQGGKVTTPYENPDNHKGLDILAEQGTSIIAAESGTVSFAADPKNVPTDYTTYGNYLIIDHGKGYTTLYAHCEELLVKAGDTVKKGDVIAKVGSTGLSSGPHLHFELKKDGEGVNPYEYIDFEPQADGGSDKPYLNFRF